MCCKVFLRRAFRIILILALICRMLGSCCQTRPHLWRLAALVKDVCCFGAVLGSYSFLKNLMFCQGISPVMVLCKRLPAGCDVKYGQQAATPQCDPASLAEPRETRLSTILQSLGILDKFDFVLTSYEARAVPWQRSLNALPDIRK